MKYKTMAQCVADLERHGQLKRIDCELDPCLEIASVQRRAFQKQGPALLFTKVRGSPFPMLGNLFGTMERTRFIFRSTLRQVETLLRTAANPHELKKYPFRALSMLPTLAHGRPRPVKNGPVLRFSTTLSALPQLVSWPEDGGAYVTLPIVCTENPEQPGLLRANLGMYRVQISGGELEPDREAGLHYQIHRGIGEHHAAALRRKEPLPVSVFVGGPPALTVAAVMPLPEGLSEFTFSGMLAGHRIAVIHTPGLPVVPAEADFCISGYITGALKPEGPFGDHLGYYSLRHDFPVMRVTGVSHRPGAIWPFTSVGRPPQEDTVFGEFIHELTRALVPVVFSGIHEVHAVDAAGVHPLLLALGSERYTPYEARRKPRELLTQGLHLLGNTQTALSKYLLLAARDDAPGLSTRDFDGFFRHMLERTDLESDLHILSGMPTDTLDYTGSALHEGSKLLWVAAGPRRRSLAENLPPEIRLADDFGGLRLFRPGILVCSGPAHTGARAEADPRIQELAAILERQSGLLQGLPLLVVADDAKFVSANWENFLWVTFTRSDPATDGYGVGETVRNRHWGCRHTLILDARQKTFMPSPLVPDPSVERRIDELAVRGGPLHGIV